MSPGTNTKDNLLEIHKTREIVESKVLSEPQTFSSEKPQVLEKQQNSARIQSKNTNQIGRYNLNEEEKRKKE